MKKKLLSKKKAKLSKFKEDYRESNPKLHMFYVKCAIKHLATYDQCHDMLDRHCNLNLSPMLMVMEREYRKLITENAAYADAFEIMGGLGGWVDVMGKRRSDGWS